MQAQKRTSPFYADFLSPYNTPAEDQRHSQGCPTEMLRRQPGNAGVFDLYPTENAFGGGPGHLPHKISCGDCCGGPGFYPAENAFGGDPDYIPHKISCGNYCGGPGFYPTKFPAEIIAGAPELTPTKHRFQIRFTRAVNAKPPHSRASAAEICEIFDIFRTHSFDTGVSFAVIFGKSD